MTTVQTLTIQDCERCGAVGVDAHAVGREVVLSCPTCGHEETRRRLPFFSITGVLALVCDDDVLLRRLAQRNRRADAEAPVDFLDQTLTFNRRLREHVETSIDTERTSPQEAATQVATWVRERL